MTCAGDAKIWRRRYFNPHEREARDSMLPPVALNCSILIHTSVKLVTGCRYEEVHARTVDFNPHEREARDETGDDPEADPKTILIHTSVKLVT